MQKARRSLRPASAPSVSPSLALKPLTATQERHIKAIKTQDCVIATGPAGTGKTYVGAAWAAQKLRDHEIDRVILTRPAVESGKSIGFLKGDKAEKFAPYIQPFKDVFVQYLGASYFEYLLKPGVERILAVPFCLIQGCSWDNSVILADEMENSTPQEFKLLLTRVGEGSKLLVSGDVSQRYIRDRSGLEDAVGRLQGVAGVRFVDYQVEDVVRSAFVRRVLEAYDGVSYSAGAVFAPV
jgi:phosphate starvation-inducible PhoH-like protein